MLAYQPQEVIMSVAKQIKRHTKLGVRNSKELLAELQKVRELGYAMNRGEWWKTVRGVAAPIFDESHKVIAAVGLFGPAERLPSMKLEKLAVRVKEAAGSISAALGYRRQLQSGQKDNV